MSNIYDDVALLQRQMNDVLSELPYKLSSATTTTVSIYYVVN